MELSPNDFRQILKHYKLNVPRSNKKTRKKSTRVLAGKLCRCIKKVKKTKYNKKASTAICISSIFKKRGLSIGRFTCKKTPRLYINKKTKRYVSKYHKKFDMRYI